MSLSLADYPGRDIVGHMTTTTPVNTISKYLRRLALPVVAGAMAGALHSPFVPPVSSLVIFTIVAIVAGVLAAIAPARRASRLNVLQALHYE